MNKEKVTKFLEESKDSTWSDEMTSCFYSDYKICDLQKWENEVFTCNKLAEMIKSGEELDDDVRQFLIDSSNGSTWEEMMFDCWVEYCNKEDYVLSCELLLSFFLKNK